MSDFPLADRPSGQYPIESLPTGWINVEVALNREPGRRYEILNLTTGLRYRQEPLKMIACKCFGLFFLNPFYFAIYVTFHLVRLVIAPIANRSLELLTQQIWALVRIPFYFLSMQCAALYGTVQPLEGRAMIGRLESLLHDGKNRNQALDWVEEISLEWVASKWVATNLDGCVFVAPCMQPIPSGHPIIRQVQNFPNV